MAELVDIVDEQDNIIGKTTRQEAHKKGLLHRTVHILILNSDGNIFIHKRSPKLTINPGLWTSSAAGHVASGQTYLEAAKRELGEELGVESELKEVSTHP